MISRAIVFAMCACLAVSYGQTISITGTVVDNDDNDGIAGASVFVTQFPEVTTVTKSDGSFHLANNPVRTSLRNHGNGITELSLSGSTLVIGAREPGIDVTIDLFSSNGSRIFHGKTVSGNNGGGAIWVRGGRFKIVNCRFFNNQCDSLGPDVGGGAVRVLEQNRGGPIYVVNSTFGGAAGLGNSGSNGGGISSIGDSWTIINCVFSYNRAIGYRGNPPENGTAGGGSGGAIYNDGNTMTLSICGSLLEHNAIKVYGAAIFFVTNDRTGNLRIVDSIIRSNTTKDQYGWHTLPGIAMHDDTQREIVNSTITN